MNKSFLGICLLFIISAQSFGQQVHFVFLQTENREPFYAIVGKKNYSSSSIGYLILPKLENGEYDVRIGFPKNTGAEQNYVLKVSDNDQGYLIKQFGEKGWGLFNLQSLAVQYSGSVTSSKSILAEAERVREKERADSLAAVEALAAQKRVADSLALVNQKIEEEKAAAFAVAQAKLAEEKRVTDSIASAKQAIENQKTSAAEMAKAKLAAEKQTKDSLALAKQRALDEQKAKAVAAAQAKKEAQKRTTDSLAQVKKDLADKKASDALIAKERLAAQKESEAATLADKNNNTKSNAATNTKNKSVLAQKRADSLAAEKQAAAEKSLAEAAEKARIIAERNLADSLALVEVQAKEQAASSAKAKLAAEKKTADSLLLVKRLADEKAIAEAKSAVTKEPTDSMAFLKTIEPKKDQQPAHVNTSITSNSPNVVISMAPTLVSQMKMDSGFIYQYTVMNNGRLDTVSAFIKSGSTKVALPSSNNEPPSTTTNPVKGDVTFLNMDFKQDSAQRTSETIVPVFNKTSNESTTAATVPKVEEKKPNVTITDVVVKTKDSVPATTNGAVLSNSNCSAQADEKDFFALRKKMIAQEGTDEMILVARKGMKEKCYTTDQIRNLAVLFLTDADRYQFLDAAYPFTYDANKYSGLVDLLKDSYFVDRFRAMIRK